MQCHLNVITFSLKLKKCSPMHCVMQCNVVNCMVVMRCNDKVFMHWCNVLDNVLDNALDSGQCTDAMYWTMYWAMFCTSGSVRWSRDVPASDNEPNSPFTDSACCLPTITCTKPSKVIILINDNRENYKILVKKSLIYISLGLRV